MEMQFVILHYINIDDTINCVNSILDLQGTKKIVIVDNGSNNGSGEKLKELYYNYLIISVIIKNENLGFVRGNNIRISSIGNKKDCLIVVCNNDLIFNNKDFINEAIDCYKCTEFAVLGPMITSEDGIKKEEPSELEFLNSH